MTEAERAGLEALRRGDRAGARELRLTGLDAFPREIFGLADTLEVLDLSGGTLDALPDDLGRLRRLRVLFCSGNRFDRLPAVLGDCAALSQVGFRGCGLREVPGASLPPRLRWLTLTDNAIVALPDELGRRPCLQKLMLSGNRLTALPETLAGAVRLELLRIAANRIAALPPWLLALPALAWLAYAGNPAEPNPATSVATTVPWAELDMGPLLGEGASGRIHAAQWRRGTASEDIAIKLFKGPLTSDGLPEHEMEACLAAGDHPALVGALGRITGHPQAMAALAMPLIPPSWRVLAGPPSLASCSRDVYDPGTILDPAHVLRIARDIAGGAAWLHGRALLHGDLYAHNTAWDPASGAAKLGDFGAASRLIPAESAALRRIEARAWGILVGELIDRCAEPGRLPAALPALAQACLNPDVSARPTLADVLPSLEALTVPA